ncbi:MAG: hypothetical protein HY319_07310 [Armatimonadetes bacterium]|nr:hypothetical protein [Armatimonadota bacterium]
MLAECALLLGGSLVLVLYHLHWTEHYQPRKREIHCDIEVLETEEGLEVLVDNRYGVDVTASFEWVHTKGLRWQGALPAQVVVPGNEQICVARFWSSRPGHRLTLDDIGVRWSWVWGSADAVPNTYHVYQLPFKARDGSLRESIPLQFWVAGASSPQTLRQGQSYTAR